MVELVTGDMVNLPIYGKGLVIETYGTKAMINFENKLFGLRKIPFDLVYNDHITKPKKEITKTNDEMYFEHIHSIEKIVTNDQI